MQVKHFTPEFQPVQIILESQEEVDALFAVLNHHILANELGSLGIQDQKLEPYATEEYKIYTQRISAIIKS